MSRGVPFQLYNNDVIVKLRNITKVEQVWGVRIDSEHSCRREVLFLFCRVPWDPWANQDHR